MIEELRRKEHAHNAGIAEHEKLAAEASGLRSLLGQLQRELAAAERGAAARTAAAEVQVSGLQSQLQEASAALRTAQAAEASSQAALGRHQVNLQLPKTMRVMTSCQQGQFFTGATFICATTTMYGVFRSLYARSGVESSTTEC